MNNMTVNDAFDQESTINNSEALYEHAPCGHISFHPHGTIVSINQTMLKWLGLTKKEDVYAKKFVDILSKVGQFYYQMIVLPLLNMQGAVNEINFDILAAATPVFPVYLMQSPRWNRIKKRKSFILLLLK